MDCFLNSASRWDMKSFENLHHNQSKSLGYYKNILLSILLLRCTKLKAFDKLSRVENALIAVLERPKCDLQLKDGRFLNVYVDRNKRGPLILAYHKPVFCSVWWLAPVYTFTKGEISIPHLTRNELSR